MLLVKK